MANYKSPTKPLTRLLERSNSPVYIVSPDFTIVYANDALAKWLDQDLSSLISAPCVYAPASTRTPETANTSGLCPPPALFDASPCDASPCDASPCDASPDSSLHDQTGVVSSCDRQGNISWRNATMNPFFDEHQILLGVMVVCSPIELHEPPEFSPVLSSIDPQQLHSALAQIRCSSDQRYSMASLVGTSPFVNRLKRQIQSAVDSHSDLLIFGPPGSGKEHTARTIHSVRQPSPGLDLLTIHCSIADQPMIQQRIKDVAEPFSRSRNHLPSSDPQWLLLLDVDQLGEAAQHELLGFFQIPNFPLRTIATATSPLIALANQGGFLVDLAHHLSTMTIELVAIKDRQIDVPLLAQALLEQVNARRDRQLSGFSKETMQLLSEYDWPENIDQLSRAIQLACKNPKSSLVSVEDLPQDFIHAIDALRVGTATETTIQLDDYLAQIESELIQRALLQSKGNKSRAAKLLGISRPKLLRRIQNFALSSQDTDDPATVDDGQVDASAFEELDP